jgi:hypothetical protein
MIWYVIAGIATAASVALLVFSYIRDRRYERKKTSQAMSRELWAEIEQERQEALARRERFRTALGEAQEKGSFKGSSYERR